MVVWPVQSHSACTTVHYNFFLSYYYECIHLDQNTVPESGPRITVTKIEETEKTGIHVQHLSR